MSSQKPLTAVLTASILVLIATGVGFWVLPSSEQVEQAQTLDGDSVDLQIDGPLRHTAVSSSWFVSGDTFWARRIQQAADASPLGEQFPFDRLDEFGIGPDSDRFDLRVTNLECPVTDTEVPLSAQEDILQFNCRPSYLDEFNQYFDLVSLANNHTDNVDGANGLEETRQQLEQAGIQHFGHYDNAVISELCSVEPVSFNFLPKDQARESGSIELPVAFCGYHGVFKLPLAEEIAEISRFSDHYLTVVMPHMGAEYVPAPDNIKTDTFRAMVDAGADVVIGGHPHWVQSTEVYNDTPIFYSLGNFLFDQEWSEDVMRGAALEISVSVEDSPALDRYLDLASSCPIDAIDCDSIENSLNAEGLVKPDFELTYKPVFSEFKDGQVFPASAETSQILLERMNWAETEAILSAL